ncbi:MAG: hypothetical protein AAGF92_13480 [Myxococcota bacterium]
MRRGLAEDNRSVVSHRRIGMRRGPECDAIACDRESLEVEAANVDTTLG